MSDSEIGRPVINPYASPESAPVDFAIDVHDDALRAQLRAFVGRKADSYLGKWAPTLANPRRKPGFNFAAFFLSGLWMGYRKMYKAALIFYAALLFATIVFAVWEASFPETSGAAVLDRMISFGVALLCGFAGNSWYLAHAKRVIAQARSEGLEGEPLLRALSKRGGTSLLASPMPLGGPSAIRENF
jgi:hypothetical protein